MTSGRPQQMGRGISLPESTPKMLQGHHRSPAEPRKRIGSRTREGGNLGTLAQTLGQGIPAPPFLQLLFCCFVGSGRLWEGESGKGSRWTAIFAGHEISLPHTGGGWVGHIQEPLIQSPLTRRAQLRHYSVSGLDLPGPQPCFQKLTEGKVYDCNPGTQPTPHLLSTSETSQPVTSQPIPIPDPL